jgi:hypothetical protein
MKLSKLREDRDYFTQKLGDIVRQLDFAGIGIIWVFRTGGPGTGGIHYGRELILPMLFLAASLAFDLLHYGYASLVWDLTYRHYDKKRVTEDTDIRVPEYINYPTRFFFWGKAILCAVAFGFLLSFLWARLQEPILPFKLP